MKRNIFVAAMMFVAVVLVGCQNSTPQDKEQNTQEKETVSTKGDGTLQKKEERTLKTDTVSETVAADIKYVDANPEAADAPVRLFRAVEMATSAKLDPQQSIALVNRLVTDYPDYENNAVALFMLASFVYDEQLHDLDKARETYQQIIDNYPTSPFADDAALAIPQLGMTPEELVKMFEEAEN